jgi:hypothetical protein
MWEVASYLDTKCRMCLSRRNRWSSRRERIHHLYFLRNLEECMGIENTDSFLSFKKIYSSPPSLWRDVRWALSSTSMRECGYRYTYRKTGHRSRIRISREWSARIFSWSSLREGYIDTYLRVCHSVRQKATQRRRRSWNPLSHRLSYMDLLIRQVRLAYVLVD